MSARPSPESPVTEATLLVQAPDCLTTKVDDEMVAMVVSGAIFSGLDPIASDILARMAAPVRFDDLLRGLVRDYRGDPAVIEVETRDLVSQLLDRGYIERRD